MWSTNYELKLRISYLLLIPNFRRMGQSHPFFLLAIALICAGLPAYATPAAPSLPLEVEKTDNQITSLRLEQGRFLIDRTVASDPGNALRCWKDYKMKAAQC
jgi:hypothetical protein